MLTGAAGRFTLCYGTLAYVMSYFMLPPIWRYARDHGLYSQADFFASKYESRWLGALVSLVGVVALIPYLVLQFKGLGIIVEAAGGRRPRCGSAPPSPPPTCAGGADFERPRIAGVAIDLDRRRNVLRNQPASLRIAKCAF